MTRTSGASMPCDYHLLPHEGIQTLKPYVPGKSAESLEREYGIHDIIKLASNENPLGCSPGALEAIRQLSPSRIAAYPSPESHMLARTLSDKLGISREQLVLNNGTDNLMTLLLTCFALHRGKHLLTHDLAFSSYAIQAKTLGIPVRQTPLRDRWYVDAQALARDCRQDTALIALATPNNPTGLALDPADIEALLQSIPESTLLVLDEAYREFAPQTYVSDTLSLIARYPNLVITRTFSKAYGLAGLRLGYAVTSVPIADIMRRAKLPFSVTQATLDAGNAAIMDEAFVEKTRQNNALGLQQLTEGLGTMHYAFLTPHANFVLFDTGSDSLPIYESLLRMGIIVRPLHPYGLKDYMRVSVGTPEQNRRFLEGLSQITNRTQHQIPVNHQGTPQ